MLKNFLDFLLQRQSYRIVELTELREKRVHGAGPLRSTFEIQQVVVGTRFKEYRYASGEWPWQRRLRTAVNIGALAAVVVGVFWLAWSLLTGAAVPSVTALNLFWTEGETALPIAVSRLSDIPGAFAWGFLLVMTMTSSLVLPILTWFERRSDNVLYIFVLVVYSVVATVLCFIHGMVPAIILGVFYGLGMAISEAMMANRGGMLSRIFHVGCLMVFFTGCLVGLVHCGLALALPIGLAVAAVVLYLSHRADVKA
jgi:hypothetical protein